MYHKRADYLAIHPAAFTRAYDRKTAITTAELLNDSFFHFFNSRIFLYMRGQFEQPKSSRVVLVSILNFENRGKVKK
jgi:hypothetical protein